MRAETGNFERGERAFSLWLQAYRERAFEYVPDHTRLETILAQVEYRDELLTAQKNQKEFSLAVWEYLDLFLTEEAVQTGISKSQEFEDELQSIQARFGVDATIPVAIWGVETRFGTCMGDYPVLDSLATLAFGSQRAGFFESELNIAIQLIARGDVEPRKWLGSWAGAFGHTQFMPSSYSKYAIGFGCCPARLCDESPLDALASTANYLSRHGWASDGPWCEEISVDANFDYGLAAEEAMRSHRDWMTAGVRHLNRVCITDSEEYAILLPAGSQGPKFAAFSNFDVIGTYNRSSHYMLAVALLANAIGGNPRRHARWPRNLEPVTRDQLRSIQQRLNALQLDAGTPDGLMGPNTKAAIRRYQAQQGWTPDGFPTSDLYHSLGTKS